MGTTPKPKIGITGIAGFIGTHLANRLVELGYEVIGIDNLSHPSDFKLNDSIRWRQGDIRHIWDCDWLAWSTDVIIHLAAEISVDKSIEDPELVLDVNINGTKNILESARKYDRTVLVASSSEVYGTALTEIQDESHELRGQSPYAASKIAADRLGYSYFKTYDMDVRIVRAFNVCGEGQGKDSYGALIAIFADKIRKNEKPVVFGNGTQTRDYTHVSDSVEGYVAILEKGEAGEVYNIATGEDWSVMDVWHELGVASQEKPTFNGKFILRGHEYPIIVDVPIPEPGPERAGEVMKLKGDATKLRALGWEPKVSFKEAIRRIWEATNA